jgi:hypothetical protein
MEEENTQKQHPKQNYDWLKQYQFQKGQSGNPGGARKGKRLKTFALELLENMNDDDKADFLKTLEPKVVWEMAEGKPKQDIEAQVEVVSHVISIDE